MYKTYPSVLKTELAPLNLDYESNGFTLCSPEDLGIDGGRWEGSIVRILPEVWEMMQKTKIKGKGMGSRLDNEHMFWNELHRSLIMTDTPSKDQLFVVKGLSTVPQGPDCTNAIRPYQFKAITSFLLAPLRDTPQTKEDSVPSWYHMNVPVDCLELVTMAKASDPKPRPGYEFTTFYREKQLYDFNQIDKSCDGFENQPTAILAVTLKSDAKLNAQVQSLKTKSGKITAKGLRQYALRNKWDTTYVPDDAWFLDGFLLVSLRLNINYQEIADFFNE